MPFWLRSDHDNIISLTSPGTLLTILKTTKQWICPACVGERSDHRECRGAVSKSSCFLLLLIKDEKCNGDS